MTAEINKSVAKLAESQIRQIMELGQGMADVIPLWFGEGDEATPEFIKQAAMRALAEDKTFYVPNSGVPELRQAIAEYMSALYGCPVAAERITATTSGMHGIMLAYQTILDPGDTVVIIGPIWPNAVHAAEVLGARARIVALREVDGEWSIDLDELFAALDAGAKALFINSPNNPTGWTA